MTEHRGANPETNQGAGRGAGGGMRRDSGWGDARNAGRNADRNTGRNADRNTGQGAGNGAGQTFCYIAFDDTDTIDTVGTGHVLAGFLSSLPCGCGFISRHQLFVHDGVPYTSHNSSMCATVSGSVAPDELVRQAAAYLSERFVPGSDPGLCVAHADAIAEPELLIEWGRRAKRELLSKEDAYALAGRCGVHLSEHGGTGQGVVGALAAVGLRLDGSDGRVRGRKRVEPGAATTLQLLEQTGFDQVVLENNERIPDDALVDVGAGDVKAVLRDHRTSIVVEPNGEGYALLSKDRLKNY